MASKQGHVDKGSKETSWWSIHGGPLRGAEWVQYGWVDPRADNFNLYQGMVSTIYHSNLHATFVAKLPLMLSLHLFYLLDVKKRISPKQ